MNMGAVITALGTLLTALVTVSIGWFVRRTDRVVKMTQANMHDQEYILKLVGFLREDYWAISDWAYSARSKFNQVLSRIANHDLPEELRNLDEIPVPKHRDLETQRIDIKSEPESKLGL